MKHFFKPTLLLITIALLFSMSACKTRAQYLKELEEEKAKYEKYPDSYEEYKYANRTLGLWIVFDSDWVVNAKYETFDDFQKKFTKYFSSETSEVLFTGHNKTKQIGVKCTVELLRIDNKKYFELIKKENETDMKFYKISTEKKDAKDDKDKDKFEITGDEVTLKNIKVLRSIYDIKLNPSNEFRFVTVLFNKNDYNYKLDLWIKKSLYDDQKEYIARIIDSIDFIETDKEKSVESSK